MSNVSNVSPEHIKRQILIHLTFLRSAILLAWTDKLMRKDREYYRHRRQNMRISLPCTRLCAKDVGVPRLLGTATANGGSFTAHLCC